jgi:orotate phosphoribosyltransferase
MGSVKLSSAQADFLENLLQAQVLKFGSFKTKSGRLSPFFLNFGAVCTGQALQKLAAGYVPLGNEFPSCNNLFGPAYKGIPLAVALSHPFAMHLGHEVSFTFNRKEAKDHGEGGGLVGQVYKGSEQVIIVEDVLTGGTSLRESIALLKSYGIRPLAAFIGVDRQEKGTGSKSAREEIENDFGLPVRSVLNIDSILGHLHNRTVAGKVWVNDEVFSQIQKYRQQYGS